MSSIVRYILRQLVVGMVLVTAVLTFIIWLVQSIKFIEMVVNKGASLGLFFKLTFLAIPGSLNLILPVALFTVVLFTYNKLISDRELVVLRAAGLSHIMLARPALILAGLNVMLGLILNIWVIPKTVTEFHKMLILLRSNASGIMLQEGQFNQLGSHMTFYLRARGPEGELLGIIIHDRHDRDRTITIMAERGVFVKSATGAPEVILFNETRFEYNRQAPRLSWFASPSDPITLPDDTEDEEIRVLDPRERPLQELFSVTEAQVGAIRYRQLRVEGHGRLASPLLHLAYALIASACLLAGWFNRRGQSDRLIIATVLLILMEAAALGANSLATKNLMWVPLLYLTPIVPALVALWVLLRPSLSRRFSAPSAPG